MARLEMKKKERKDFYMPLEHWLSLRHRIFDAYGHF